MFDGPPKFAWIGDAKFKNLGTETDQDRAILASFGVAVARAALGGLTPSPDLRPTSAQDLRDAILQSSGHVGMGELLTFCWAFGIPVLNVTVFPLGQKRMHAMTVRVATRYTILIGRESSFPAQIAYVVAHEIAHVLLRHVSDNTALLEMGDPLISTQPDEEEAEADRFALALLTGYERPEILAEHDRFSARQLAQAALDAGPQHRIDPGVLALCVGHSTGRWARSFSALKLIPDGTADVRASINKLAASQLDWGSMSRENQDYLRKVLGSAHGP
ncbi:MAG: ImmA/IrrE family metallo-endopeptidase [Pseudonocardiaceae bacterium]